ncbi:hypothetical protein [Luteimonas panaciterrae]|uniref:hypothetical protein n=1 Tax=Luteimonas panaciterrae TaxID=363885 RepID=UPI001CFB9917|nr:hypothetical protein [Luteimonas panaciterrae]
MRSILVSRQRRQTFSYTRSARIALEHVLITLAKQCFRDAVDAFDATTHRFRACNHESFTVVARKKKSQIPTP